jgi:hypothetical protein
VQRCLNPAFFVAESGGSEIPHRAGLRNATPGAGEHPPRPG